MAFHKDLKLAIVAVGIADTGSGGLVNLTGKTNPIIYHRSNALKDLPIVAFFLPDSSETTASDTFDALVQFSVFSDKSQGDTYIEDAEDMRDRIKTIMTNANLSDNGVDVAPMRYRYREVPSDDDGVIGLILDIEFEQGK